MVAISSGTTTQALARALRERSGLTIVSNSLLVAEAFFDSSDNRVICTGGELRGSLRALVGSGAVKAFQGLRADIAFLSGHGLDAGFGLSALSVRVGGVDKAIAGCVKRLVVLADHSKLGVRAVLQTVPIENVKEVVTDAKSGRSLFPLISMLVWISGGIVTQNLNGAVRMSYDRDRAPRPAATKASPRG